MRLEKKATIVSSTTAVLLIIIKLFIGILSGSVAVLASAIDSVLDLAVSIFNYFAVHNSEKAPDDKFNFGRGKIEAIASVLEGVIITLSGVYIFYTAVQKLLHESETQYLEASIIVMVISVIMTGALVMFLNSVSKQTGSMVIKADALHYKTDLYSNIAIIIALVVIQFTSFHMIDAILGILIAIYIVYSAFELIKDGTLVLMDVAMDDELIEEVKNIIDTNPDVVSYHQLFTRSAGQDLFVSVHLVFNISISLFDAHRICDKIEDDIADINKKFQWHIIIHPDPYDDSEINEMEDL